MWMTAMMQIMIHDDNKGKDDEFDDNIDDNKSVNNDDDGDVTSSPSYWHTMSSPDLECTTFKFQIKI